MTRLRLRERIGILVLLVATGAAAAWLPPAEPAGMTARVFPSDDWSGQPVIPATVKLPFDLDLLRALQVPVGTGRSVEWTGYFLASRAGRYTFFLRSGDRAELSVGGIQIVGFDGEGRSRLESGELVLREGSHHIRVRYATTGPASDVFAAWQFESDPVQAITSEHVTITPARGLRVTAPTAIKRAALAVPVIWALLLIYAGARWGAWWIGRVFRREGIDDHTQQALVAVLVLAAGLSLWGITWGTLGDGWAPDELEPFTVRAAWAERLMGGWHEKYPAMHFAILSSLIVPFDIAEGIPGLATNPEWVFVAQHLLSRLVSVVMGLGFLVAAFLCGREYGGRTGAVAACLALALTPLYVTYSKLANLDIPSLCWLGWAFWACLRIIRGGRTWDYALLGGMAAAAVATKDQAYASLVLLPLVVLGATYYHAAPASPWRRLRGALFDRRLWVGAGTSLVASLVLHNVLLNPGGFVAHLRELSGYHDLAVVPRTLGGWWELTWRSADMLRFSMGWPLTILASIGIARAVYVPSRRWQLWLLVVPLGFHLSFTSVTYFNCDRYMFPTVFVGVLFVGAAVADLLRLERGATSIRVGVVATFALTLAYGASINAMMDLDSRKTARTWVVEHAAVGARAGLIGPYVPGIPLPVRRIRLATIDDLRRLQPDVVVVNARFSTRFEKLRQPESRILMRGLSDGSAGYRLALHGKGRLPAWAWLQYDSAFTRHDEAWWTNLSKINPGVLVFARR